MKNLAAFPVIFYYEDFGVLYLIQHLALPLAFWKKKKKKVDI